MSFLRERGMGASILVAALSSAFGVTLLATTRYIGFLAHSTLGDGDTLTLMIGILSIIFIVIAMYVGAIVTANTFSTIVAGRTRQIALMRLIGSTARAERRKVASQGLLVGLIGALLGLAVGIAIALRRHGDRGRHHRLARVRRSLRRMDGGAGPRGHDHHVARGVGRIAARAERHPARRARRIRRAQPGRGARRARAQRRRRSSSVCSVCCC